MWDNYSIFWGDTHHNTYQQHLQDPPLTEIMAFASSYLDFYTGAYYTPLERVVPLKEGLAAMAVRHPAARASAGSNAAAMAPAIGIPVCFMLMATARILKGNQSITALVGARLSGDTPMPMMITRTTTSG